MSHAWKTIQDAAVALVQTLITAGTINVASVDDTPFDRSKAADGTYPICRITRGLTTFPQLYITGTEEIHTDMLFTIVAKAVDTTDDQMFDICDKIVDTINGAITISGTAVAAYPMSISVPELVEDTNYKALRMVYSVQSWRDF